MLSLKRSLQYYPDEKYQDIPFGTVYCVAGKQTNFLNIILCAQSSEYENYLNNYSPNNYLNSNVVFLDVDNDLFEAKDEPAFYSPIIPREADANTGVCFYVWHLKECNSEHLEIMLTDYYSELLQILDSIVDNGDLPVEFEVESDGVVSVQYIEYSIGPAAPEQPFPDILSRIEISPPAYKVLLPDYDRRFYFTAQVKAIYVLFLLHPEGILMKDFENYKDEYRTLYFKFTNRSDVDKIRQSINRFFDTFSSNAISVKKSQCNNVIKSVIPIPYLRFKYLILARKGKPHTILLDRNLVSLPDDLLQKNW